MSFTVVIPARYASTRLPGKPLLDIAGKPMIRHVWERAMSSDAAETVIATDDARIETVCREFGARVCMTSPDHPSGTDRLQEVVARMQWGDEHIVVNVQGDEPLLPPEAINQVAANLARHSACGIATLSEPLDAPQALADPNTVKVVSRRDGRALYFSRAPVPWDRDQFGDGIQALSTPAVWQRHIGIYAYRCGLLQQFVHWPVGELEQLEKLEQLRAMENGVEIHVQASVSRIPPGVDTAEDLEAVRAVLSAAGAADA